MRGSTGRRATLAASHSPRIALEAVFDFSSLRAFLGDAVARFDVDHIVECGSTNTELACRAARGAVAGAVLVCDRQTAGRGRRGRQWTSVPGASLTFSLLWRFDVPLPPSGLPLAVGLAVARALRALGVYAIRLKWPNDIWLQGRKLGGVLVESAQAGGRPAVIIGIGLNLSRHDALQSAEIAALSDAVLPPPREQVLAAVLRSLGEVLDHLATHGFASLREEWISLNVWQDRPVRVIEDVRSLHGICRGVDDEGALLLESEAGVLRVRGGDVSLREAPCTC